uniref:Uncharacterized protein n=1 Tax=Arundo donax TaxID=35708 RepID=A0A0A9FUQ8_ARUDO
MHMPMVLIHHYIANYAAVSPQPPL